VPFSRRLFLIAGVISLIAVAYLHHAAHRGPKFGEEPPSTLITPHRVTQAPEPSKLQPVNEAEEEPTWLELNESAREALEGSCPASPWVPPLETGFILLAEEALPTLRDLGVRLPSYAGGMRLVGVMVVGAGNRSQALEELSRIARYGASERLVLVYAFPGRNVTLAIPYATYAMSGPEMVLRVGRGRMNLELGYGGTIRGCPYRIEPFRGKVTCTTTASLYFGVPDLEPGYAELQVGDLYYTVEAYLPEEELYRVLESIVPPEGCPESILRPEVHRIEGYLVSLEEAREALERELDRHRAAGEPIPEDAGLVLPAYVPERLRLEAVMVREIGAGEWAVSEVILAYADHACSVYNVPAPWVPDAQNLTIWVEALSEGGLVPPGSAEEVLIDGVAVYVWPMVEYYPTKVEFWFRGLAYTIQGYYPLDEILRVAESIIRVG